MSLDRLRRLRAYFIAATTTLGHIPAPVPPRPEEGWDGPTFDTRELYEAYSRLPADLQELAASSHLMCEDALAWQHGAAVRAFMARSALAFHLAHGTELTPYLEDLARMPAVQKYAALLKEEADDGEEDEDEGEDLIANVQREIAAYARERQAARDQAMDASQESAEEVGVVIPEDAAPDDAAEVAAATATEPPESVSRAASQRMVRAWAASATVVAAVCAGLLIWHHAAAPAPVTAAPTIRPINELVQTGDLTAIVSYAEHNEDETDVHVHVINAGPEPAPANLSLGEADRDPPAGPILIPAKSAQHRVLRVRKDRDRTKAVKLQVHKEIVVLNGL